MKWTSKGQGEEMRAGRTRSWAVWVRWGLPGPGRWGREPVGGREWPEDDELSWGHAEGKETLCANVQEVRGSELLCVGISYSEFISDGLVRFSKQT